MEIVLLLNNNNDSNNDSNNGKSCRIPIVFGLFWVGLGVVAAATVIAVARVDTAVARVASKSHTKSDSISYTHTLCMVGCWEFYY